MKSSNEIFFLFFSFLLNFIKINYIDNLFMKEKAQLYKKHIFKYHKIQAEF